MRAVTARLPDPIDAVRAVGDRAARSANTSPGACTHGPRWASAKAALTCADSPV